MSTDFRNSTASLKYLDCRKLGRFKSLLGYLRVTFAMFFDVFSRLEKCLPVSQIRLIGYVLFGHGMT